MDVAVIGGTRLVGPFVVEALVEAGHSVCCYNRGKTPVRLPPGVRQITVDRTVPGEVGAALGDQQPDAVIDMIAYDVEAVDEVAAALPALKHYVFCGSTVVYGVIGRSTPSESSPIDPDSPYGAGKVACERYMSERQQSHDFRFTSLRLAHPYGPGDHILYTTGRESLFLDRMRTGRQVIVPGSGQSRLHAIYAGDAGRAFVHVLNKPECMGKIYNLAGEKILTMDEYFESIARVLGVPLNARKVPHEFFRDRAEQWAAWKRKFDCGYAWVHYESAFDITALRQTGFRCEIDHDPGVALTMEWLDKNDLVDASSDEDEEDRLVFDE